ncbi:MAG: hypothetical protein COW00_05150 [Bdellovibrio sp. CG12_big_fil_rev_8_21_14_0_65_39_13]|nr:MAG: hypothetical protein COW78_13350 [Bdellovibrio sp. CG22_combo_CG10-13_8_21_14_all_39_27]PIQ61196.1 MAG: hypothetical protein COW00_05150 [Bdellovibrio sp. CG12_big_fil_rev_8_21_14_0_65_39_13]PIR34866.1 MAG: hypothetical protein COV37_11425 [Bdellovibrio sp. CG11_big_fil_rev_8_21_14_0_20_39_38]
MLNLKKLSSFFCILLLASSYSSVATSSEDDVIKYKKCYVTFVRKSIDQTDPLLKKVNEEKISGVQACQELLQAMSSEGDKLLINHQPHSLDVFRTLNSFHRSWFAQFELNIATQDFSLSDFYDVNEMAFHLTRAFFNDKVPFSSILKSKISYQAIRKSEKEPILLYDNSLNATTERLGKIKWDRGDEVEFTPELVQFGEYVGIEKLNTQKNKLKKNEKNHYLEFYPHRPIGAGIIGTMPYILLNSGQNQEKMDGKNKDHRRWAKSVLRDFLCLDVPLITEEQAAPFVKPKSEISFQTKAKCMQCHATLDNMAGVIRNIEIYNTTEDGFGILSVRAAIPHKIVPGSSKYYNQSTQGRIVMNLEDQYINKKINNIEELADWMIQNKQLYRCSLKKVFSFLTGEGNPNDSDKKQFIDQLSNELMVEQNYKNIFMKIIGSKYF